VQIPFIGGAYKGRSTNMNAQECINLYPVMDKMEAKNVRALVGTPGMALFSDPSVTAMVRGLHVIDTTLYAVVGNTLYKVTTGGTATAVSGTLGKSTDPVWMADDGTNLMIVEPGIDGYTLDTSDDAATLTAIANADFPTPSSLTWQDGYFIVTKSSTGEFYISTTYDPTAWDATDYATAESNPDNLLCCISDHGELWLFGAKSIEVWYNSGAADFPFVRIQGVFIQEGLGAALSVAQIDNSLVWFTEHRRVVRADGYSPQIISTPHLEYLFNSYEVVNDAIGFGYVQEGHSFYVLIFPDQGKTWVFDAATQYWHERKSYTLGEPKRLSRHRANCYAFFNGKHLIGDYANGKIYEWDMDVYSDAGEAIHRKRTAQVIHSDRKNIFFSKFEIDFEAGTGLITGQGKDPQAMLKWSDDSGHTWGNEHWSDIGKIGKYDVRAIWRRMGRSRNRVMSVSISDPVKVVMIAANLEATQGVS
jgi:hypothetical protein